MKISTTTLSTLLAAACLAAYPVASYAHDEGHAHAAAAPKTTYGQSAELGTGIVRTYVVLDSKKDPVSGRKAPVEMGVEIPGNVLYGLPQTVAVAVMDFPIQARDTPFQYMTLDWNPLGHEPAGVYDRPHFDFHFYIQDPDEVAAIEPGPCSGLACDDFQRAMKPLPAQYNPQGYINVGSVVPYMGNHLIDPTSPEFNGKPFTRTWLYGTYDGQITFYEPMITHDYLLRTQGECSTLKLPAQFAITGYYPKQYCSVRDAATGIYKVYLKDFTYRVAPQDVAPAGK